MRRVLLCLALLVSGPAAAQTPDCEGLAEAAGARHGVPAGLMAAIARTESGWRAPDGSFGAWPWTLNQGGDSGYFTTQSEALAALDAILARGVSNVDVGCMQLNHRWHAGAFPTAEAMIDPVQNTEYAAAYLASLAAEHGGWEAATRRYHSADPDRGAAYAERVAAAAADRAGDPAPVTVAAADPPSPTAAATGQGLLLLPPAPLVALAAAPAPAVAQPLPNQGPRPVAAPSAGAIPLDRLPGPLQARADDIAALRAYFAAIP